MLSVYGTLLRGRTTTSGSQAIPLLRLSATVDPNRPNEPTNRETDSTILGVLMGPCASKPANPIKVVSETWIMAIESLNYQFRKSPRPEDIPHRSGESHAPTVWWVGAPAFEEGPSRR